MKGSGLRAKLMQDTIGMDIVRRAIYLTVAVIGLVILATLVAHLIKTTSFHFIHHVPQHLVSK